MKFTDTTKPVSVFKYRRRKARAEACKAQLQEKAYQHLLQLGYYSEAAQQLAERAENVRPGAELTQEEADALNQHFTAIRRAQENIYHIEKTTRLL